MTRYLKMIAFLSSLLVINLNLAPAQEQTPVSLRIAGWNLEGNGETDSELIADQLADKQGVDVWGLSEVRPEFFAEYQEAAAEGEESDFGIVKGTTGGDIRLAIVFDKSAVELLDEEELTNIQPSSGQRAPLVARFKGKRTGQEFLFVVNHLARGDSSARRDQAKRLNQWGRSQAVPVLAVGDYNFDFDVEDGDAGDRDPGFDILTKDEVFLWLRPLSLVRTQRSFDSVLDFVFVVNSESLLGWSGESRILDREGDAIAVSKTFTDDDKTTDHRPVDAIFTFAPSPAGMALLAEAESEEAEGAGNEIQPVDAVPGRTDDNVIVAAYNIKFFGREQHDNSKLAEVIQHFDVCGILEVQDETELPRLVDALEEKTDKDWGYVFGVRTHRPGGVYHEAYAAVWRRDRVELGDGVVGGIWDLEEMYRNDPYIIAFRRKEFDFALALIHTRWSDDDEGTRADEVLAIADHVHWMKTFITERDVIIAGDFNYPGSAEVMQQMAEEANLEQLDNDPKSTYKTDGSGFASSYDHMFVVKEQSSEFIDGSCNTLHVPKVVYGNDDSENMREARRELSDHLPVFAVFDASRGDDDPNGIEDE